VSTPAEALGEGVCTVQRGFSEVIRGKSDTLQAERTPCWLSVGSVGSVGSVDWMTVPAGPVRVMVARRSISRAIRAQVSPVAGAATRASSSVN